MKSLHLLTGALAVGLVVLMTSCSTPRYADDYYNPGGGVANNRVYVDDPYRGTVILERDPYSGRYYEVGSYGAPYGTYGGGYYGGGNYGRYRNYPSSRVYRSYPSYPSRNGGQVNTPPPTQQQPAPSQERAREEARDKVLGRHN